MNQSVISGTRGHGISGTCFSAFQEPERCSNCGTESRIRPANLPNPESFGFFLTAGMLPEGCERSSSCDGGCALEAVEISPNHRTTTNGSANSIAVEGFRFAKGRAP